MNPNTTNVTQTYLITQKKLLEALGIPSEEEFIEIKLYAKTLGGDDLLQIYTTKQIIPPREV